MDNKIFGYFKISPYIIKIEILYVHDDRRVLTSKQQLNAAYYVIIFKVIEIQHMVTQQFYNRIYCRELNKMYEINNTYEDLIKYYLTYERAFNENFFENSEYKLFSNYSQIYNAYDDDGNIIFSFYHKNGKIDGELLQFNKNGKIENVLYYKKGHLLR